MGSVDRRRRILVNGDELHTDQALREAVADAGFRLDAKVRVADVLRIERSGLSSQAYGFALRSHFDWVISDADTTMPEFAVEFDGPSHLAQESRARDALKDEICRQLGLPLLRIDHVVLRPFRRRTVLAVLVAAWALYRGFVEAQEAGHIPWDEIFDAHASLEPRFENGKLVIEEPYNLARPAANALYRMSRTGAIIGWRHALRHNTPDRSDDAYAWAYLSESQAILGRARVRSSSFPAFPSMDLADDLALLDLADRLQREMEGGASTRVSVDDVAVYVPASLAKFETAFDPREFPGWSFGGFG